MIYGEAKLENGKMVITNEKVIDQNTLTSDCWLIQINGLKACETCSNYKNQRKYCRELRAKFGKKEV